MAGHSVWFAVIFLPYCCGFRFRGNETGKEFIPDNEEVLLSLLSMKASEVEEFLHSGRKLLHRVRVWQSSHPAESTFAKCVVRYCVDVNTPDLVTASFDDEDGRRGLSTPVWIENETTEDEPQFYLKFQDFRTVPNRILDGRVTPRGAHDTRNVFELFMDEFKRKKISLKRKTFKKLYVMYVHLSDFLTEHRLLGCAFRYVESKFWEWIDSAP